MIVMQPGQGMNTGHANCTCELDGTDCCTNNALCFVPVGYLAGRQPPNYPVPAVDYYNRPGIVGDLMEWSIDRDIQLAFRS